MRLSRNGIDENNKLISTIDHMRSGAKAGSDRCQRSGREGHEVDLAPANVPDAWAETRCTPKCAFEALPELCI